MKNKTIHVKTDVKTMEKIKKLMLLQRRSMANLINKLVIDEYDRVSKNGAL